MCYKQGGFFDLGVNMSTLIVSRRVLLFHENLVDIYETHFPGGMNGGQVAAIASHHHVRISVDALDRRGFLSIRGRGLIQVPRATKRGTQIKEDQEGPPLTFPVKLIGELTHRPRRAKKRFRGKEPAPPIIVGIDGETEQERQEATRIARQSVTEPEQEAIVASVTEAWPPNGINDVELYLTVMSLRRTGVADEHVKKWARSHDIILRAFWLARGLTGRRIFATAEKRAILMFCGHTALEVFDRLVRMKYIAPLRNAEYELSELRPPRKHFSRLEMKPRKYVSVAQIKQALRL